MSLWQAVVFDLDDTLYPEREYVRGGFQAVAAWAERSLSADRGAAFAELWAMFEDGVRGDTFDRWLRTHGHPVENRAALIEAYRGHRPQLTPYPDVVPAIGSLRGRVRLGLITEGVRSVQEAKLEALGLRSGFDKVVIFGEDVRSDWKPSRAPFDRWLEGSGVAPEAAVYLADNPAKDFLGARRAGWASIRVRRSDGLHRDEEPSDLEGRPDAEVPDLRSLIPLLRSDSSIGTSQPLTPDP